MERSTTQRRAIQRIIEEAGRPLAPQEVLEAAQAHAPGLGIATVYRALKSFTEEGLLEAVELPGESVRYEMAGKHHHHHFHCRECARVFEVEGCDVEIRDLAPRGFKVDGHEIVLYGHCAECASKQRASKRPAKR